MPKVVRLRDKVEAGIKGFSSMNAKVLAVGSELATLRQEQNKIQKDLSEEIRIDKKSDKKSDKKGRKNNDDNLVRDGAVLKSSPD
ncbi:MAG: hypothetical protein HQK53_09505, partial [Oligoflexia bacterium]|nr:hypothetical protein [Oligoflexia bacterium]